MSSLVLRDDHGRVAVLTINRPERMNAFNSDVKDAITSHLDDLTLDDEIRAVVLTGAGDGAFCAGADLQDTSTHTVASVEEHLADLDRKSAAQYFEALLNFPKPLICAVNGYAIGIGFQMQLCCDIIVAASTARFQLPQVQLGIMPAYGGAPRLAQWVGRGKATEIALTGRFVDAEEAERIGLAAAVHPPEELLDRALELAMQIAQASPLSVSLTKQSMHAAQEDGSLRMASAGDAYRFMNLAMTRESGDRHENWRARDRAN